MSASMTQSIGFFRILGHAVVSILARIGHGLVQMAEAGPRMAALRALNAMSDEDLAARGVTRADMVRRIFGPAYYM